MRLKIKGRLNTEENTDLPGSNAQVRLTVENPYAYPSGRQYADNPQAYPPFHRSPDHTSSKENRSKEVIGWGADLDHSVRPAYPKERIPARDIGVHWDQPEPQIPQFKIFHSTERPGITPVFGTSAPPRGLSGVIRKWAYRLSENNLFHWLTLLFADRVDMVEGVVDDLKQGHLPNFYKERGLPAEWKYNRPKAIRRIARWTLIVGCAAWYLNHRYRRDSLGDA